MREANQGHTEIAVLWPRQRRHAALGSRGVLDRDQRAIAFILGGIACAAASRIRDALSLVAPH
jgi:hypothetical protein